MRELFVLNLLKKASYVPGWLIDGMRRRDPHTWVFGAWYGENYSDNCRDLFEYVSNNCPEINAVWITRSQKVFDKLRTQNKNVAFADSKEGIQACQKAKYTFISNTVLDVNEMHINGSVRIWLWHGHPLKKIVYDQPLPPKTIKQKIKDIFPPCNILKADIVINSCPFFSPFYQTAFRVRPDQVIVTGSPRNDSMFEKGTTPFIVNLKQRFPGSKILIYMPTFRDVLYRNQKPFDPFGGFGFDLKEFLDFLEKNNLVFLYKGHYVDIKNQKLVENNGGRLVFINDSMYDNLYSFIKDTDILVTDYSSIYFDYLLLKKPIILTPFDKDDYCNNSRPMYYDYDDNIEGIRAHDWKEFIDIVNNGKYYVPSQKTVDKYHSFQDGNSSKRVTDYILSIIK